MLASVHAIEHGVAQLVCSVIAVSENLSSGRLMLCADAEQQDDGVPDQLPPTSQQEAEEQLAILQDRLGQSRAARDRAAAHSPDAPGAVDRPQLSSEVRRSPMFRGLPSGTLLKPIVL